MKEEEISEVLIYFFVLTLILIINIKEHYDGRFKIHVSDLPLTERGCNKSKF